MLDCNCTICRRYGVIWTYPEATKVSLVCGADCTDTYVWGAGSIAFHRCKECGCVTHFTGAGADTRVYVPYGINVRMIPTLDPASVQLRQMDNSHTGFFWTVSTVPRVPSHHPKMPPPGPDDWR